MGRYFVNELGMHYYYFFCLNNIFNKINYIKGSCGSRVYIPFRGCEMEVRHLKPMFDLGQVN